MEARYLAAVRACGNGALLSGRAAAYLLGIVKGAPPPPEVTAPTERRVRRDDAPRPPLDPSDPRLARHPRHHGPPHARGPRRRPDGRRPRARLPRGRRPAPHDAGDVEAVLARRPDSPGAAKLRAVLRGDVRVTLSTLERGSSAPARGRLPLPQTNRLAGGRRVDCRWPEHQPDRRARRLPLPPLPPRLGAGPPPRARGPRARRRVPPLHVRRRLRAPAADALRPARTASRSGRKTEGALLVPFRQSGVSS